MLTSDNCRALSSTYFHAGGSTQNTIKFSFPQRYAEAFDMEMNHFINVIKKKENSLVSKDDVVWSLHVVDAIEKSLHSGKPATL